MIRIAIFAHLKEISLLVVVVVVVSHIQRRDDRTSGGGLSGRGKARFATK